MFSLISDKVVFPIPKCGARKWSDSPAARKIKPPETNYLLLLCLEFHLNLSIVYLLLLRALQINLVKDVEGNMRIILGLEVAILSMYT